MAQKNTYNVYSRFEGNLGSQIVPIWLDIKEKLTSGGSISVNAGDYIPAGSPIIIKDNIAGGVATVFVDGTDDEEDITGLLENDIFVHPSSIDPTASVSVITKGKVLSDRLPDTVTDTVREVLKERITFIKEA